MKLGLDPAVVRKARELAARAAEPVIEMARTHTTVSVERAVLRLAGVTGADADGTPWVNRIADAVRDQVGSGTRGGAAVLRGRRTGARMKFEMPTGAARDRALMRAREAVGRGVARIDRSRADRDRLLSKHGDPEKPVDLPDRRDRRHPRGHPAGPGGGPRGRRRHRGDPLDGTVPARLRAGGRHPPGGTPGRTRPRRTSASCGPPSTRCPASWGGTSG